MKYLKDFIDKYKDYSLSDILTYNSYRTGQRSEIRTFDSVSVTEILGLIIDNNMQMVKKFYSDKMQEACDYGTEQHKAIENYIVKGYISDTEVFKHFRLFTIKYGITDMQSELDYKTIYKDLPPVTGTIDCIAMMNDKQYLFDWKTSRRDRSFKSIKYNIQKAGYRWLSGIKNSGVVYLNKKGYEYIESTEHEYWDIIWLELLEYANTLFKQGKINNLYTK